MWGKVLKNKNFLFLLENHKGVLSNLLELRKEYFTNETHYEYFRRYVKPKLSMVINKPTYSYKVKMYWRVRNYEVKHSCSIYVSQSYLVISFYRKLYRVWDINDKSLIRTIEYHYLLGFNSDGKLFVNRVGNRPLENDLPIIVLVGNGSYDVSSTKDEEIRRILGYNYDVDGNSEVVIDKDGIYRVQGEIVISVHMLDDIEEHYKWIIDRVKSEITDLVESIISDRIASILIDMGFNISVFGIDRITIQNVQRCENTIEDKVKALSIALLEEIKKNFDVIDYSIEFKNYSDSVAIDVNTEFYGNFSVGISYSGVSRRDIYGDIFINVFHPPGGILENKIIEDLYDQLKKTSRRVFKHVLGNHYIEVKNALSTNITYKPPITPLLIPFNEIRLNNNLYYVDKDSEIIVSHKEHGICRVKITKPSNILITTTQIHENYQSEVNRVVLSNIYEKYMSKINQYFKNDVI
jgi:hypothetical protein